MRSQIFYKRALYCFVSSLVIRVLTLFGYRVGFIASGAIGHLIVEMEMAILNAKNPKRDLWFTSTHVANSYVLKEYSTRVRMFSNPIVRSTLGTVLISITRGNAKVDANYDVGPHNANQLDNKPPLLRVPTGKELANFVNKYEIGERPIVTLCVRDQIHSLKWYGEAVAEETQYRNVSIDECEDMINFLIDSGFSVLRMGRDALPPTFTQRYLIDYANSNLRSDTLDVAIFSLSQFCLSTGTGLDDFATAFRKKVYQFNSAPFFDVRASNLRPLVLPKQLVDKASGIPLGIDEIRKSGAGFFRSSQDYEKAGIEIRSYKSGDLVLFAKDVIRMEKGLKVERINASIQNRFVANVVRGYRNQNSSYIDRIPLLSPISRNYFLDE